MFFLDPSSPVQAVHTFRVTRNADLERHEDEADDLLDMVSDELRERRCICRLGAKHCAAVALSHVEELTVMLAATTAFAALGPAAPATQPGHDCWIIEQPSHAGDDSGVMARTHAHA